MRRRTLLRIAVLASLAMLALAAAGFYGMAQYYTVNDTSLRKADAIIVLGSHANADGTLTPVLRSRVMRGVELWKDGYAPKMIVTGGAVANAQIEALAMARYAMEQGVPQSAIIVEPKARSTAENAKLSARILSREKLGDHIILVTSAYHMRRALGLFTAQNLSAQSVAVPYPDESGVADKIRYLMHESGGFVLR